MLMIKFKVTYDMLKSELANNNLNKEFFGCLSTFSDTFGASFYH